MPVTGGVGLARPRNYTAGCNWAYTSSNAAAGGAGSSCHSGFPERESVVKFRTAPRRREGRRRRGTTSRLALRMPPRTLGNGSTLPASPVWLSNIPGRAPCSLCFPVPGARRCRRTAKRPPDVPGAVPASGGAGAVPDQPSADAAKSAKAGTAPAAGQVPPKLELDRHGLPKPAGGRKEYTGEDGQVSQVVEWFGFKLHLLVDTRHEVSLAYQVSSTKAGDNEGAPSLVDQTLGNPFRTKGLQRDQQHAGDGGEQAG